MLSVSDSPQEVCRHVYTRVQYSTNETPTTTTGQMIWDIKKGNCLGISKAVNDACKSKGYLSRIQIYFTPGKPSGHAIAMGVYKDKLWICDNGKFQYVKSKMEIARIMRREHIPHGTIYSDTYDENDESKLKIADE